MASSDSSSPPPVPKARGRKRALSLSQPDPEPPRITFHLPGGGYMERIFNDSTLEANKDILRQRLSLGPKSPITLFQLRGDKRIELFNEDDFAAFRVHARTVPFIEVEAILPDPAHTSLPTAPTGPLHTSSRANPATVPLASNAAIPPSNHDHDQSGTTSESAPALPPRQKKNKTVTFDSGIPSSSGAGTNIDPRTTAGGGTAPPLMPSEESEARPVKRQKIAKSDEAQAQVASKKKGNKKDKAPVTANAGDGGHNAAPAPSSLHPPAPTSIPIAVSVPGSVLLPPPAPPASPEKKKKPKRNKEKKNKEEKQGNEKKVTTPASAPAAPGPVASTSNAMDGPTPAPAPAMNEKKSKKRKQDVIAEPAPAHEITPKSTVTALVDNEPPKKKQKVKKGTVELASNPAATIPMPAVTTPATEPPAPKPKSKSKSKTKATSSNAAAGADTDEQAHRSTPGVDVESGERPGPEGGSRGDDDIEMRMSGPVDANKSVASSSETTAPSNLIAPSTTTTNATVGTVKPGGGTTAPSDASVPIPSKRQSVSAEELAAIYDPYAQTETERKKAEAAKKREAKKLEREKAKEEKKKAKEAKKVEKLRAKEAKKAEKAKELQAKELQAKELQAKELQAKELQAKELQAKELQAKELQAKKEGSGKGIGQAQLSESAVLPSGPVAADQETGVASTSRSVGPAVPTLTDQSATKRPSTSSSSMSSKGASSVPSPAAGPAHAAAKEALAPVPATSRTKKKKKGTEDVKCDFCNAAFHLRYKCPIIAGGPDAINARIAEIQNEKEGATASKREALEMVVRDLEEWISKARKDGPSPLPVSSAAPASTPAPTKGNETEKSKGSFTPIMELPTRKAFTGAQWTPTIPSGSKLSEVTVQTPGEGSSEEDSDSVSDSDNDNGEKQGANAKKPVLPAHAPSGRGPSVQLGDVDVEALLRGPIPSQGKRILSVLPSRTPSDKERSSEDDEMEVEVEEDDLEELKSRKNRKLKQQPEQQQRVRTLASSSEDDEGDGDGGDDQQDDNDEKDDDRADGDRQASILSVQQDTNDDQVLELRGKSMSVDPRADDALKEAARGDDYLNLDGSTVNDEGYGSSPFDFTQSTSKDPDLSTSSAHPTTTPQNQLPEQASSGNVGGHRPPRESMDLIETASEPSLKDMPDDPIELAEDFITMERPRTPPKASQVASHVFERLSASPSKLHSPGRAKQMRDRHGKVASAAVIEAVEPSDAETEEGTDATPVHVEESSARGRGRGRGRARGRSRGISVASSRVLATAPEDNGDDARPRTRSQLQRNASQSITGPLPRLSSAPTSRRGKKASALNAHEDTLNEPDHANEDSVITVKPLRKGQLASQSLTPLGVPSSSQVPPSLTQWATLPPSRASDASRSSPASDDELVSTSPQERDARGEASALGLQKGLASRFRTRSGEQSVRSEETSHTEDLDKVEALTQGVETDEDAEEDPKPQTLFGRWSRYLGRSSQSSQEPAPNSRGGTTHGKPGMKAQRASSADSDSDSDSDDGSAIPKMPRSQPPSHPIRKLSEIASQPNLFTPRVSTPIVTPFAGPSSKTADATDMYGLDAEDDEDDDDSSGSGSDSEDAQTHIPKNRRAGVTPSMMKRKNGRV